MEEHYTAWLTTASDCTIGEWSDVSVSRNSVFDGIVQPEEWPVQARELPVKTSKTPGLAAFTAADRALNTLGYRRVGAWTEVHTGGIATVEKI